MYDVVTLFLKEHLPEEVNARLLLLANPGVIITIVLKVCEYCATVCESITILIFVIYITLYSG